tara:strand:- start:240 stop:404 length:165 start_codon:yes stop_codon:yes gene_type:complete
MFDFASLLSEIANLSTLVWTRAATVELDEQDSDRRIMVYICANIGANGYQLASL